MDPVRNPYSPGAGTPPPYLAGREELIAAFDTLLGRAAIGNPVQPMVLSGLRGVGKTVLLLKWRSQAEAAGWAASHGEARTGADLRGQLAETMTDLPRHISHNHHDRERPKRVSASFIRAAGAERLTAVVGACHRVNQERLPALVVGAGLPTVGKCSRTPSRTRSASSTCAVSDHSRATHRTRRSPNPLPT